MILYYSFINSLAGGTIVPYKTTKKGSQLASELPVKVVARQYHPPRPSWKGRFSGALLLRSDSSVG